MSYEYAAADLPGAEASRCYQIIERAHREAELVRALLPRGGAGEVSVELVAE